MARPSRVPPTKAKQNGAYVEHLDLDKLHPRERTLTVSGQIVVLPGKLLVPDRMRMLQLDRAMSELDAKMERLEQRAKVTPKQVTDLEEELEALDREIFDFVMALVRRRTPDAPDLELNFLDYTAIFSYLSDGQAVTDAVLAAITSQQAALRNVTQKIAAKNAEGGDPLGASTRSRKRSSGRSSGSESGTTGSRNSGRRSPGVRSASTRSRRSAS